MSPNYNQNAVHRIARTETAENHAMVTILQKRLATLAAKMDASRPEGFGPLESVADMYKEMSAAFVNSNPEYSKSLTFIRRAKPKRVERIFSSWDRLRAIVEQHKDTIKRRWEKRTTEKRKLPLPAEYSEVLHTLGLLLHTSTDMTLGDLALMTAGNSALRKYYRYETGDSGRGYGALGLTVKPNASDNNQLPPTALLLNDLQDTQQWQVFGFSELFDEIEHMMHLDNNHKSQKELIDIPMANLLSKMTAFGEIAS
ncbi:hypothetical protein G7Y89_g6405 [Cudoniella acicularis]|uniref:Uncharacterized protein n=1 Tax=Cudoniella acicularis TaxID=354080 RepID=A0A8H4RKI7_9HELO|nr:hypothetical protein G7Y89_g6405 [Cudoniella acicularis]